MNRRTAILIGDTQRHYAKSMIDAAERGAIVTLSKPSRTNAQNAKLWAMLSDVSQSKPDGREMSADLWKAVFMNACGHQVQFCEGLDGGQPFPVGFRSSRLTIPQCADLITVIIEYGDRKGVAWNEAERGGFMGAQE